MPTEAVVAIVGTVAMAVGMGIARGLAYLRRDNGAKSPPVVTGEIPRPVTVLECRATHEDLARDLKRGSDKFDELAKEQTTIKETVLELRGDVRAGFAEIKGAMDSAAELKLDKHLRDFHRRSSTGEYGKRGR